MAFTAHYDSINLQNDQFVVVVTFSDSATSFVSVKTYNFPTDTLPAAAQAAVIADGTIYKTNLATLNIVRAKVGTSITI